LGEVKKGKAEGCERGMQAKQHHDRKNANAKAKVNNNDDNNNNKNERKGKAEACEGRVTICSERDMLAKSNTQSKERKRESKK
jgi:hypothetical protein